MHPKTPYDDYAVKMKVLPFVLITIILYAVLFLLNCLSKRFTKAWLKLLSWGCYLTIPTLITYTIGLLSESDAGKHDTYFYILLSTFILFGYTSFDNLTCFTLQERNDRTSRFFQFIIQVFLLLRYTGFSPSKVESKRGFANIFPSVLMLVVVCFKIMERIAALAHAAGATVGVRQNLRRIINYTNMDDQEDHTDPVTMKGFKILVGPRYSTIEDDKIVDGITLEKIWGLLGSNGQLKDTCLSFSLFWLLLGKYHSYPLYKGRSKEKAWKLVREGLLGGNGEHVHERVFRVIEVELCFLYDYFYTKYFFFYLNGVWWKLYFLALLLLDCLFHGFILVEILLALEVIQIAMFICSRWFRVISISYVAKRKGSKGGNRLLTCCIRKAVIAISRISLCTSTLLGKPWKRKLDQYSLLESCTSCGMDETSCVQAILGTGLGIPVRKPGRKLSSSVTLSKHVKRAVVQSLRDMTGPRLSNGVDSLKRNEVENELSWACKLEKDAEVILVWHIATSICEMSHTSQQHAAQSLVDNPNINVATSLSKYCAYLLAFSPSLLSVPRHEADLTLDNTIQDASELLSKCSFLCFKGEEANKYQKLMGSHRNGGGSTRNSTHKVLQRGLKLGEQLLTMNGITEERRWKIVAELWAEMILFMAPSMANSNELVHAERLADGGEFITVLWALLIHAGFVDRQDLVRSVQTDDDEAEPGQSSYV